MIREVICPDFIRRTWNIGSRKQNNRKTSKLQQKAVDIILSVIPGTLILQEVPIPVGMKKMLYFDIYLPRHKAAIEIMCKQHRTRITHFQTKQQYSKQIENDRLKQLFCEMNDIDLIYFWFDEKPEDWETKLRNALYGPRYKKQMADH